MKLGFQKMSSISLMQHLKVKLTASHYVIFVKEINTCSANCIRKSSQKENEIPVIRYPIVLKKKQVRNQKPKDKMKGLLKLAKPGKLLISGDDKHKTMYTNEFVGKFSPPDLMSSTWTSIKSPGRHLTIHATKENPALKVESGTFEDLGMCNEICKALSSRSVTTPTAVQSKVIPSVLSGQNVVFAAETGSGKTLSYLLPIVQSLLNNKKDAEQNVDELISPSAIVLTPSKELCEQVLNMAKGLCLPVKFSLLKAKAINKPSKSIISNDVMIGTPLQLLIAIKQRKVNLSSLKFAVIDECDTLFDDSFIGPTKQILQRFNIVSGKQQPIGGSNYAQLLLCSATFPNYAVSALNSLLDMENIAVLRTGYLHRVTPHVTHKFLRVKPSEKLGTLLKILNTDLKQQCIVFCNSRHSVKEVSTACLENGIPIVSALGGDDLKTRKLCLSDFQDGKHKILIATDLASRGLDTKQVGHVINFEIPGEVSDYIHRCGRVGRVGQTHDGFVTNLVSRKWEISTVMKIEEAARRREEISSVNANIKKQHKDRWEKQTVNEMELI